MVTAWRWPFRLHAASVRLARPGRCKMMDARAVAGLPTRREGRPAAKAATVLIVENERKLHELVRSYWGTGNNGWPGWWPA